jgi:hypothetical protein
VLGNITRPEYLWSPICPSLTFAKPSAAQSIVREVSP